GAVGDRQGPTRPVDIRDAAAVVESAVARECTIGDAEHPNTVAAGGDATADGGAVADERTADDGRRSAVVDPAPYGLRGVAAEGAVEDGKRSPSGDAATDARVVVGEGAVGDGQRAAI